MSKNGRNTYYFARLIVGFGTLILAVAVPYSVQAGLFSALFDTVSADSSQIESFSHRESVQTMSVLSPALNTDPNPMKGGGDIIVAEDALVPPRSIEGQDRTTNLETKNGEINQYVVREGDTLSQIASMFDVSAKTILWANDITNPSTIQPGTSLIILPITGVRHVVKKGDTIATIAKRYEGDVDDILAYNQLASAEDISVGDTIVVPGGVVVQPAPAKTTTKSRSGTGTAVAKGNGSAGYTNPLPGAIKTQGIHGYNGVDLSGVPVGTAVLAAAGGEVIVAKSGGYNGGYGSYVVIKHTNGTQTLYGHLSNVAVAVGQTVAQGQKVGGMGNSGRSTGPHLHFEVRGARNPF